MISDQGSSVISVTLTMILAMGVGLIGCEGMQRMESHPPRKDTLCGLKNKNSVFDPSL